MSEVQAVEAKADAVAAEVKTEVAEAKTLADAHGMIASLELRLKSAEAWIEKLLSHVGF